jgi:hypothetical protein
MKKMFKTYSKSYTARALAHSILQEIDAGYDTYEDAVQFKRYGFSDPVVRIRIVKKLKRVMKKRGVQI